MDAQEFPELAESDEPWPPSSTRPVDERRSHALHGSTSTRTIEHEAIGALPPHTLMRRAGLASARLAMALAPHARSIWLACGPGNNGGDGLEAALQLRRHVQRVDVTLAGDPARLPPDAAAALARCQQAGVRIGHAAPAQADIVIDALLGIGTNRPLSGELADHVRAVNARHGVPVLAVDVPSGLDASTGQVNHDGPGHGLAVHATHTLSLLTLKPGLFTGAGRDHSGQVWLDDLGVSTARTQPDAWLRGEADGLYPARPHASHKGSHGDVLVVGGARGMAGAALLCARGALAHGAGRALAYLLDDAPAWDTAWPELMLRHPDTLDTSQGVVVAGPGGGEAIRPWLPRLLQEAPALVLDADALNALAAMQDGPAMCQARARDLASSTKVHVTVLTPHPLEAARLLGCTTAQVQADRLRSARELADRYQAVVVLKGSGSVVASPAGLPSINASGNALLATAGTGDVLAGMIAARLAQGDDAHTACIRAVWRHGHLADLHLARTPGTRFTASSLLA